ncbi:MAG: acyl carrier protein [Clostridia bacterium]|nr:acyl carrier protein [Clostridia bacterium]
MTDMLEKINEIISNYVDLEEPITEETSLRGDLGMSSLDLINLAVEVEDTFDVMIPDKEINSMNTVKDLITYLALKK